MDGRPVLFTTTVRLSFSDKNKFARVQDIHYNGKETDEIHNESFNDFNLVIWCITRFDLRNIQSILAKFKISFSFCYVRFSYVLRENKKKFRK